MNSPSTPVTASGIALLLVLLGLYAAWVIIEIRRDWFSRPRRPTRFVAAGLAALGALSVLADVVGAHLHLLHAGWWSTPVVAFLSCLVLGAVRPSVGIQTAYRFMTVTVPASLLAGPFFLLLLAFQAGGCLLGFRLGEAACRLAHWVRHPARAPHAPAGHDASTASCLQKDGLGGHIHE